MDFETLKEMIKIITRNKVKQIEVLGNPGNDESRTEELYNLINKGNIKSEAEAIAHFFGNSETGEQNFKKLRNKLFRQLINTAFFVDAQKNMFSDRQVAFVSCNRDYAAANIIWGYGGAKTALFLYQQLLEQTIRYEFTDLTTEVAYALYTLCRSQDQVNHDKYVSIFKEYEEKRRWEFLSLDRYDNLTEYYLVKRSPNMAVHQLANKYFDELLPMCDQIDTFNYFFNTYRIGVIKYMSIYDWKGAIEISDKALKMLKGKKTASTFSLLLFSVQKLSCHTQLRMFEAGEKTAHDCLELCPEGGFNWYRVNSLLFYHYIYTQSYEKALELYRTAVTHSDFSNIDGIFADNWYLFGGYLHLLAALKKLPQAEVTELVGPFRYSKFINEFEVVDKDKEGMNIPLVLLPVLFSVVHDEYLEFGRSTDALEKYRQRYLNNDLNRRSECFLKMLIAYSKRAYEPEASAKKIKKELEILRSIPIDAARQTYEVEIIPYEDLWEMILDHHAQQSKKKG